MPIGVDSMSPKTCSIFQLKRDITKYCTVYTELGYKVVPWLRELAPRGLRELEGGIHATPYPYIYTPLYKPIALTTE